MVSQSCGFVCLNVRCLQMLSKRRKTGHLLAIAAVSIAIGVIATPGQNRVRQKPKPQAQPKGTPTPTPPPRTVGPITDPSKCKAKNALTLGEINEILNAHNSARAEQQLPPVTWDCRLAELAQEWANQSIYEHRDDSSYGENIFVSGSSTEPIASVVKRWMLEKPNWNNQTATCADGKVCTHYAQVMWRATKSIGCGINRSATGKWKAVVVCNYDPASKASGPAW